MNFKYQASFGLSSQRTFFRQLAVLYRASIPIADALELLASSNHVQEHSELINRVTKRVCKGSSLSDALHEEKSTFSGRTVALIHIAENNGDMSRALDCLARDMEARYSTLKKLQSQLIYPAILALCSTLALIGFLWKFLPQMIEFSRGLNVELPFLMNWFFDATELLTNPWVAFGLLQLLVGALAAFYLCLKTDAFSRAFDRISLRIPLLREIIVELNTIQFARGLSSLLTNGCPLSSALQLVGPTLSNSAFSDALEAARFDIENNGDYLSEAIAKQKTFPPIAVAILASLEEAGCLDRGLETSSEFLEQSLSTRLEELASIIEPLIILAMGLVIGGVSLVFFLPMVKVISQL